MSQTKNSDLVRQYLLCSWMTWHFDSFWHDILKDADNTLTDADICQLSTHLPLMILMVISTGLFYVNGGSNLEWLCGLISWVSVIFVFKVIVCNGASIAYACACSFEIEGILLHP